MKSARGRSIVAILAASALAAACTPAKTTGTKAVIKVVELVGASPVSFEDAIQTAVRKAAKSLRHITGVDVRHATAAVTDGRISEYRVDLKVAFALDDEDDD